jgi:hypothetical protein
MNTIGKIHTTEHQPDGWHDHVIHQRSDDSAESGTDDEAHGHVDCGAGQSEPLELPPHVQPPCIING